jgi:hypothetical protein
MKMKDHTGLTSFTSDIEGVPFSKALESVLETYDDSTFLRIENRRNYPISNLAFEKMKTHSKSIFLGKVSKITQLKNDSYSIRTSTKHGDREVIAKYTTCICREGKVRVGNEYVFYANKDESNRYRLVDEWLSIMEPGEYETFKWKK